MQLLLAARMFVVCWVVLFCASSVTLFAASVGDVPAGQIKAHHPQSKIASHLLEAMDEAVRGRTLAEISAGHRFIKVRGREVRVDVRLDVVPDAGLLDELKKAGLTAQGRFRGLVSGTASLASLDAIANNAHVTSIHPDYGCRVRNAGTTPNQADATLRAALARTTYNVDGAGINIGVLSDSIKDVIGGTVAGGCLTGSSSQASGNLPTQVGVLDAGPGGGTDEGAGMAELIYDLCPGSHLAFHTAWNSISDFAQGIIELANSSGCGKGGCHVICDDVIYFAEPMFQDGEIAQAINTVVASGVPYFSSAGNEADTGMEAAYREITVSGLAVYDFTGSGDGFLNVNFGSGGGEIYAVLQWNQPYSGTLGPGSEIDLDLYLTSSTSKWTNRIVAASYSDQGDTGSPSGDPVEIFGYYFPSSGTRYIVIHHYAGSTNLRFRLVIFVRGNVTFQSGILGGATIYGHPAAAGAVAVAASYYKEVDYGGSWQGGPEINVESYSSKGGNLPFYFDGSGNALPGAPVYRFKPDLTSVDGTNTSFFGSPDTDSPADGFPNFYGTSAASPHLAAIAALMLDRALDAGVSLSPAEVYATMRLSATDIETAGRDTRGGDGLVFADNALNAICIPPSVTGQPGSMSVCEREETSFCVAAAGTGPLTYQWMKNGVEIDGATQSCTTIPSVVVADAGSYTCRVSSSCGVTTSDPAALTVNVSIASDFDDDCDVDAADVVIFAACITGPGVSYDPGNLPADCTVAPDGNGIIAPDFDGDGDVDQSDFGIVQRCLSGENIPADSHCAE